MRNLALAVIISTICLSACDNKPKTESSAQPQLVKTYVVGGSGAGGYNTYPGRVSAGEETRLSFTISGTIADIPVLEGQAVKKGDIVAKLNPRNYQNAYDEAKAQSELAKVNLNRFAYLLKSNTVSRSEYDQKEADYKVAVAKMDTAKKALEDTMIKVPYDGIIAKRYVEQHETIQAKQPILLLQNLSTINVELQIPEQDIINGGKVEFVQTKDGKKELKDAVSFSTIPGVTFDTSLSEFATSADPKTQTYLVRLLISDLKNNKILSGMTAQVRVKFQNQNSVNKLVPIDAVSIDENGKNFVWVIDKSTLKAHKKIVTVGSMKGGNILITSGLEAGELIVIAGVNSVQEGLLVKVMPDKLAN